MERQIRSIALPIPVVTCPSTFLCFPDDLPLKVLGDGRHTLLIERVRGSRKHHVLRVKREIPYIVVCRYLEARMSTFWLAA